MKQDILKQFTALRVSLEEERAGIQARLKQIQAALGGEVSVPPIAILTPAEPRRKMSAAGRRAIAAAAKARWAAFRAKKRAKATGKAGRPRRRKGKLSAAGRARIIAAQKARWARVRAAKARNA